MSAPESFPGRSAPRKVLLVAGARPNYMKIAPICWAMRERCGRTLRRR